LPASAIENLFSTMAKDLADEHARQTKNLSFEEKLNFLKKLLAEEGFIVEWEKVGDDYHIREVTCPYLQVGQEHPQVCLVDQTLISMVLAIPAQKISCVLTGDNHCTYVVPMGKQLEMVNE
jgi:predicted ArsR family transcriptional regulator